MTISPRVVCSVAVEVMGTDYAVPVKILNDSLFCAVILVKERL
jgi:hypothetical protein